jgi:predicted nucleic acid-binding protein
LLARTSTAWSSWSEKYSDFPLGAVDASVLAIAERLDADAIATLDRRHFSVVRLTKPIALLP